MAQLQIEEDYNFICTSMGPTALAQWHSSDQNMAAISYALLWAQQHWHSGTVPPVLGGTGFITYQNVCDRDNNNIAGAGMEMGQA